MPVAKETARAGRERVLRGRHGSSSLAMAVAIATMCFLAADWPCFRGPKSSGESDDAAGPTRWTATDVVLWKTALPGFGASSPITWDGKIFVTSYNGYGLDEDNPGRREDLRVHLTSLNLSDGSVAWAREIQPAIPEQDYRGFLAIHGYASGTPATDGERVYVAAGRSGVLAFTMAGRPVWRTSIGSGRHEWGSATSVVLHGDLVIVNASVESGAIIALNKADGKEAWRREAIRQSWSTPLVAAAVGGREELVVSTQGKALGIDPNTGAQLWECESVDDFVCPSVIAHGGVAYITGGSKPFCMAVRLGGRGDVTESHRLWKIEKTPKVATPLYQAGRLHWIDHRGNAVCIDAANGALVYEQNLHVDGRGDKVYASLVRAGDKLYGVTRQGETIVLAPGPKLLELARNSLDDPSAFHATPAVCNGRLLIRSDRFLYCIGN